MPLPLLPATARGVIACAPELIYKALIDYDAWQEWVPSLISAKLLTREDILAIVEVGLDGKDPGILIMECIETPRKGILARVIEGKASLHEMEWRVEAADPGFARVSVTVKRRIGLHLLNPASWQVVNPAKCLAALGSWMSVWNQGPEAVTDGENIFELWETEAGLVCWIRGRKYRLTPAEGGSA